jgi:hypothetical protein
VRLTNKKPSYKIAFFKSLKRSKIYSSGIFSLKELCIKQYAAYAIVTQHSVRDYYISVIGSSREQTVMNLYDEIETILNFPSTRLNYPT